MTKKDDDELELDWKGRAPRGADQPDPSAAAPVAPVLAGKGVPGNAKFMSPELQFSLEPILRGNAFTLKQLKEWGEILTGWETRNRYEVFGQDGRAFLYAGELGEGIGQFLLRNLWFFRTMKVEFMTFGGTQVMTVTKPMTWLLRRFEVHAWDGRLMAVIQQRFSLLHRRFDILTAAGAVIATVEGALWRPWTFVVKQDDRELAVIRKEWRGFGTEYLSDADTFGVELKPELTDARLRQVVLAMTLAIDLSFFEQQGQQRSSGLRRLLE